MATIVQVNKRGSLTLPAEVRRHFNLQADAILMVEKTPEGILLRPAQAVPLVQFDEPAREGMRKVVSELAELYQRRQ
jgi:AbrB family looped-hinge helix DNA binding protein